MERLQKIISNSGYCSRRKAEELILKGKVKVNGILVRELGTKVESSSQIEVDGTFLSVDEKSYILLNKPRGVVTTTHDDKGRKTVIDLLSTDIRVYPVGRLDYDTTGALLLTNDGELANRLMHPKSMILKTYLAKVEGIMDGKTVHLLENGVLVDGKKTSKAKVKVRKIDKKNQVSFVEITIHEGRNHQVKKMFDEVGFPVIKLTRERYSFLDTKGLKSGEYRYLNPKEVKKLYFEAGITKE